VGSESFEFDVVNRVAAGAVGPPGKRVFFLQISHAGGDVTLKVEKEQLRVLADRLLALIPESRTADVARELPLREPLRAAWAVGAMTLAYDESEKRFDVSLVELVPEGQEPAVGRFGATLPQMRALVHQALAVVAAGRPPCPVCGGPIDHDGGICPRANGHRS
jgi:uncharacterized repeat protein (TIGR03847 family)